MVSTMSDAAVQTRLTRSDVPRQPKPIQLRQSLATISATLLQETASISCEVTHDIVLWSIGRAPVNAPNEYANTMRRMAEKILEKHASLFRGMIARLNAADMDLTASMTTIADDLFGDGEANWGRIVVLCAFVARLSRHFHENMGNNVNLLSDFLRLYFNERLNNWIATQGGWNQFTSRFQESSLEPTIFKGLLATGLALGVVAGVLAMR